MNRHHETIIQAAFDAAMKVLTARELDDDEALHQHEKLMNGWMNDLDQDQQAIEDFNNGR